MYDVDNDGKLDIIEYDNQTQTISTWINQGNATFSLSGKYPFKGFRVLFGNKINGDFQNEVITLGYGENKNKTMIVWFYSLKNGNVFLKDSVIIDKTSGNRVIVPGHKDPEFILFNKKGEYKLNNQTLRDFLIANHSLGDVNGDGFLDILQCNYHLFATTHLYVSDGAENLKEVSIPFKTFFSKQIDSCFINQSGALADLDNDGDLDIYLNRGHQEICCSKKSEILFNDGLGNFKSSTVNLEMVQSISAAFGDLDGDGDLDAFLACGIQTSTRSMIGEPNRVWINTTVEKKNQ